MENKELTEAAQSDRADFTTAYGEGNCSCHISPPCGSCTHPGNPINQEDDDCWVLKTADEYQPGQWWLTELENLWGHGVVNNDTKRAAKIACEFAAQVFAERGQGAAQPAPRSDEALQLIADGATHLINQANDLGVVLTVEQKPLRPLAMGHYETKFSVRAARERAQ